MPRYSERRARPTYRSCGKMVVSDGRKALKLASHLRGLLNVEYKFHIKIESATAMNSTPSSYNLCLIPQDVSEQGRNGNQIKLKRITVDYYATIGVTAVHTVVRFILIQDRQCNGAGITSSELLDDTSVNDNLVSGFKNDNKYRFNILSDRTHRLSATGMNSFKGRIKKKVNMMIRYDASTGDISSQTSNNISLLIISNEPTYPPIVTFKAKLLYVDN